MRIPLTSRGDTLVFDFSPRITYTIAMKMVKNLRYTINIERDEDGIFVVSVPALPGCFTQGKTLDEAFRMAQDAIRGFLTVFIRRGKKIPIERVRSNQFTISVSLPNAVTV